MRPSPRSPSFFFRLPVMLPDIAIAGVNPILLAGALLALYLLGYVSGALLISPVPDRPPLTLGIVRGIAGLLLSATLFMLSMAVGLRWWAGPAIALAAAVGMYRVSAFALPRRPVIDGWEHVAGAAVAFVLLAPVLIASLRMAPGPYPPVFFSVDTPYFLEKVHALVRANELPPPSLGMLNGRYVYHYGSHAAAALISRVSFLPPHHTLFLVVTPALVAGIFAAAIVAVRAIGARIPWLIAVPLLVVSVPSLWYPFWLQVTPRLVDAFASGSPRPLRSLADAYELWGVAGVNGQNLASQFIVLAVIGGIVAAPIRGWRLPVFLIGSAVLFKAQTGLALVAGFALMELWEARRTRSIRPLARVVAAAVVFGVVYSALWILPRLPVSYRTELFPFYHFHYLEDRGWVPWYLADVAWLLVPALLFLSRSWPPSGRSRLSFLILAITPLIMVNAFRGVDLRPGMGYDEDWFQIIIAAPVLIHALVLMLAESGWPRVSIARKTIFGGLVAAAVVPAVIVSTAYSRVLIERPAKGHEFVDNHALARALQAIPVKGSLLVTNDLRYPAGDFARKNRQMQIPALFGHQAFAINYAYEVYDFSADRQQLQQLLEGLEWVPMIDEAARHYGWTHLIIRKDYPHPVDIPLAKVFDSPEYEVFRFPRAA